jgi:hypothetical protein
VHCAVDHTQIKSSDVLPIRSETVGSTALERVMVVSGRASRGLRRREMTMIRPAGRFRKLVRRHLMTGGRPLALRHQARLARQSRGGLRGFA